MNSWNPSFHILNIESSRISPFYVPTQICFSPRFDLYQTDSDPCRCVMVEQQCLVLRGHWSKIRQGTGPKNPAGPAAPRTVSDSAGLGRSLEEQVSKNDTCAGISTSTPFGVYDNGTTAQQGLRIIAVVISQVSFPNSSWCTSHPNYSLYISPCQSGSSLKIGLCKYINM